MNGRLALFAGAAPTTLGRTGRRAGIVHGGFLDQAMKRGGCGHRAASNFTQINLPVAGEFIELSAPYPKRGHRVVNRVGDLGAGKHGVISFSCECRWTLSHRKAPLRNPDGMWENQLTKLKPLDFFAALQGVADPGSNQKPGATFFARDPTD